MPSKKKPMPQLPAIPQELIDRFVTGSMSAEAVHAASMAFKKALIGRALGAEMSHHWAIHPGQPSPRKQVLGRAGGRSMEAEPLGSGWPMETPCD